MITGDQIEQLLTFLGEDYDVIECSQCGALTVVSMNDGLPQTCQQLECVYKELKNELETQ